MTTSLIRNMVFARAMSVEPFARALCPDACGVAGHPFARSTDRWRSTARRAALASPGEASSFTTHQEKPG